MTIPDNIIAAVNALLAPYGESFTQTPQAPSAPSGGFLSLKDAAKYAGVSRAYLYRHTSNGDIKTHKLGKDRNSKVVIARADIDRFILSRG